MKKRVTIRAMKTSIELTTAQERMRRRHGAAVKASPAPVYSPAQSVEVEQHFTPGEIAKQWGISPKTVRRMFSGTPGVLKLRAGKRVSLRIPGRLLKAWHSKLSACRIANSEQRIDRTKAKIEVKVNVSRRVLGRTPE